MDYVFFLGWVQLQVLYVRDISMQYSILKYLLIFSSFLADKLSTEVKKCGVTKTISPPTIKQEPLDDPNQSMLPDSSSDPSPCSPLRRPQHKILKTEHFEVKQEPACYDGEVITTFQITHLSCSFTFSWQLYFAIFMFPS